MLNFEVNKLFGIQSFKIPNFTSTLTQHFCFPKAKLKSNLFRSLKFGFFAIFAYLFWFILFFNQ